MKKTSIIKIAIALLVFMALYGSFQIPVPFIQKIIQVTCLGLALVGMFLVMRTPEESGKRILNIVLSVAILACLLAFLFVKP